MAYRIKDSKVLGTRSDADAPSGPVDTTIEQWTVSGPSGATTDVTTTSYTRPDTGIGRRPVIMAFNGGPGSSSGFLGSGLLAPWRIDLPEATKPPVHGPFRLVDNNESLLAEADVVLIDPPGTGMNRVEDSAVADFLGINQDADTALVVIRAWLQRHARDGAPTYLLGESFGAVRLASILSRALGGPTKVGEMHGMSFAGAIILGGSFDMSAVFFGENQFLYAFTAHAATAWHHKKAGQDTTLSRHVEAADEFAVNEMPSLLYKGQRLSPGEKQTAAAKMSKLIGLSPEIILDKNFRIDSGFYASTLLSTNGHTVGAYDSRFVAPAYQRAPLAPPADPVADDSAMGQYSPAFAWASRELLRRAGVDDLSDYRLIDFATVNGRFDWGHGAGKMYPVSTIAPLRRAMEIDSTFRLFVAAGLYDLVTPIGSASYAIAQISDDSKRAILRSYESGHMPYIGDDAREELARDLREFLEG
ncbi:MULTISPECIES: peptidase S10 [unclassified Arthrobacter]|uniref:S10 family serine carboxypeptidase-like protein n=1 Tax=unclassified Arthrobacter TaxID=235627 RepID=UPI0011B071BA|nr:MULTISPECIES: peptidase S10 [unclassified Arthrobacter]